MKVRLDRTGDSDIRRCTLLEPRRITLAERAIPVLPDLAGFKFAGKILETQCKLYMKYILCHL